MKNNVQLITYVDRLTGSNINELNNILNEQLAGLFSGIHLLPFYYPIDGSDAGFDPIDHTQVDSRLGSWQDVKTLGENFDLMADLIVNHMSAQSAEFQDVLSKGKDSAYWDLFLTKESVFPEGLSKEDQEKIKHWMVEDDRKTYVYGYTDYLKLDLRDDVKEIGVPVTIIAATLPYGKEMAAQTYKTQYENLKDYNLILVENSAHFIMLDQPERFLNTIEQILSVN